jgi:hypothetical protein
MGHSHSHSWSVDVIWRADFFAFIENAAIQSVALHPCEWASLGTIVI